MSLVLKTVLGVPNRDPWTVGPSRILLVNLMEVPLWYPGNSLLDSSKIAQRLLIPPRHVNSVRLDVPLLSLAVGVSAQSRAGTHLWCRS